MSSDGGNTDSLGAAQLPGDRGVADAVGEPEPGSAARSDPTMPPAEAALAGAAFEDRRTHRRRAYQGILRVTINGREFHCKAVDLSAGGICCGPLPAWCRRGDPVLVQLYKPARKILGRVAWRRTISVEKGNVLIGVCFTRSHPDLVDKHLL